MTYLQAKDRGTIHVTDTHPLHVEEDESADCCGYTPDDGWYRASSNPDLDAWGGTVCGHADEDA